MDVSCAEIKNTSMDPDVRHDGSVGTKERERERDRGKRSLPSHRHKSLTGEALAYGFTMFFRINCSSISSLVFFFCFSGIDAGLARLAWFPPWLQDDPGTPRCVAVVKAKKDGIKETIKTESRHLQANEILLLPIHGAVIVDKFINLVGIHLVRRNRIVVVVVVTGYIILASVLFAIRPVAGGSSSARFAEDACPLAMGKLTAFGFTDASIAEIGAFKRVALKAADSLVAVSIKTEITADWGTWRQYTVSIRAIGFGAVATFKMNAMRRALGNEFMRQVARLAIDAVALLQQVLARGNLGMIVSVTTHGALGA